MVPPMQPKTSSYAHDFYKENQSLPLEEQMTTAMPDVRMTTITGDNDFVLLPVMEFGT